jgi:5-methylcytosine-specific restriction endonuclease McrA
MEDKIIGQNFGYWKVLERVKNDSSNHIMYKCQCICGEIRIIRKTILINGKSLSCGCNGNRQVKNKRFGRLLCLSNAYLDNGRLYVRVICDCGIEKIVMLQALSSGATQSCGCYNKEILKSHCKEKHWAYNPNLTEQDRKNNNSRGSNNEYQIFRKTVIKYCNNTCQCCGNYSDRDMRVHHIMSWNIDYENRLNSNNAILLCPECHDIQYQNSFHNSYGNGNNTPQQLEEYINNKRKELGINIPFTIESYLNGNVLKPNTELDIYKTA